MTPRTLLRRLVGERPPLSWRERVVSALACALALLVAGWVGHAVLERPPAQLMTAAMGASAVLLFAMSHSPVAEPWPILGSYLVGALVGVSCARLIPDPLFAATLAVAGAVFGMLALRCLHPPGGAVALIPVLGGIHDYGFVLVPVLLDAALMVATGLLVNNAVLRRRYPGFLAKRGETVHHHRDPLPMERLGITGADLKVALARFEHFVDVGEDDLRELVRLAGMQAVRRSVGEIRAADIMSRDLITVGPDAPIDRVWELLRYHRVSALPVIDLTRRVLGMVTLLDFIRHANPASPLGLREALKRALAPARPQRAAEIMTRPVITVRAEQHVVELVPLLSDRGLHRVPVVDAEGRLLGMIAQSDVVAALYAGRVAEASGAAVA